jgi:chorismate mutase
MESITDQLESLRVGLQELDLQLVLLLQERFRLTHAMGNLKKELNIPPLQEEEWQRKVGVLASHLSDCPRANELLEIFYLIHNLSVRSQEQI